MKILIRYANSLFQLRQAIPSTARLAHSQHGFLLTTPYNNDNKNIFSRHHSSKPKNRPKPKSPPLEEADLEENFVKGSGPGGQCINKRNISVSLIHKPTGLRVQCHESRSREQNRRIARKYLAEKVDVHLNPGHSAPELRAQKVIKKKYNLLKKRRRKERKLLDSENGIEAEEVEEEGEDEEVGEDGKVYSEDSSELQQPAENSSQDKQVLTEQELQSAKILEKIKELEAQEKLLNQKQSSNI